MATATVNEGRTEKVIVGPTAYDNTAYAEVGMIAAKNIAAVTGAVRTNGARKVRISFISNDADGEAFTAHPSIVNELHKVTSAGATDTTPATRIFQERRLASLSGVIGSLTGINATTMPTTSYRWAKTVATVAGGRTPDNQFSPGSLTVGQVGVGWVEFDVSGATAVRCICVCANSGKLMRPVFHFFW